MTDSLSVFATANRGEFWAMVGALATIALVIATLGLIWVANRGLTSLGLTQRDMVTRATRDARACAVELCTQFRVDIIPLNLKIMTALGAQKARVFVTDITQVKFPEKDADATVKEAMAWVTSLTPELQNDTIRLLNTMEVWNQKPPPNIGGGFCVRVS